MTTRVHIALVLGICVLLNNGARGQSDGLWKNVKGGDMEIEVPGFCSFVNGEFPGGIAKEIVKTAYVNAYAADRGFFINANSSVCAATNVVDADVDDIAKSVLMEQRRIENIAISRSNIDTLLVDPRSLHVTQYKVLGQCVREATAKALNSGQQYKIFVLFGMKSGDPMLRMFMVVVGCRNDEINEYGRLMSHIVKSFTLH
jgi:hypothetical protein